MDKPFTSQLRIITASISGGIIPKVTHTEIKEYETSGFPAIEAMMTGPV
jgi:hypothetical protein